MRIVKVLLFIVICLAYSCDEKTTPVQSPVKVAVATPGTSVITCPKCGHKKTETLPTDVCQLTYTCEECKTTLHPKDGDCCVFCSYGDHKCPSKQ